MTWYKKLSEDINWIIKLDTDERFDPLINSVRSVIWVCKLRTSKLFSKILPTIHTSTDVVKDLHFLMENSEVECSLK